MKIKTLFLTLNLIFIIFISCKSETKKTSNSMFQNVEISKTPIENKTLSTKDYSIHYYMSGKANKETVVFLHPAFSDHRAFDYQIDFFSQQYKVISIDLLGHGLSKANKSKDQIDRSAEHIKAILETENCEQAHIVGVSMGSLIAQYFALEYPQKVISISALGGYDINMEDKEVQKAQRSSNFSLIVSALFSMETFRKKTAEITCYTQKGKSLFYESSKHYKRKSFMVMQGLQNIIKNREINTHYPILIATGEHDIELAKKMAKEWHLRNTKSRFEIISNAGHCANMDQPEAFNQLLFDFISTYKK